MGEIKDFLRSFESTDDPIWDWEYRIVMGVFGACFGASIAGLLYILYLVFIW